MTSVLSGSTGRWPVTLSSEALSSLEVDIMKHLKFIPLYLIFSVNHEIQIYSMSHF